LKKLENEKENLIENKTEMREKMDAMEDERRTLHETIQKLKVRFLSASILFLARILGQHSSVRPRATFAGERGRRKTQFGAHQLRKRD